MNPDEIGLLLLINQLHRTQRTLGRDTLVPFAQLKLPTVAQNYDALVQALLAEQLVLGSPETFTLTPAGIAALQRITAEHSLPALFYDVYYQAVSSSRAHAAFCERVYGIDLCQHGMADKAQIHRMIDELQLTPEMQLLDFGCGDGRIAEYLADLTHTRITGVDIAQNAIKLAQTRTQSKRSQLQFFALDVERTPDAFPPITFDRIYAVDSIFFAHSQQRILEIFHAHLAPGGLMAIFIICPPHLTAEDTPLALALHHLGLSFRVCDLSAENFNHWTLKKQTLLALEGDFYAEGADFLFKNRMAECNGLEQFHRYLFTVFA